jgi:hypothetical protein
MDFIERWFDVSPDGGSGRLEITSIIVALVVVAAPFLIIKFGSHPGWKPSLRSARLSLTESMTTRWIKGRKPSTGCAPWRACPSIPRQWRGRRRATAVGWRDLLEWDLGRPGPVYDKFHGQWRDGVRTPMLNAGLQAGSDLRSGGTTSGWSDHSSTIRLAHF